MLLAQNGNLWNVSYFSNSNWTAPPAMGMQSSYIDFNWGTVPPGPGMPSTNWTATMTSSVYFYYTGTYIFKALADDEVSLQIEVWGNCTPGTLQCMQLECNQAPVEATCSKTGAGWFYYGPCPTLYQ